MTTPATDDQAVNLVELFDQLAQANAAGGTHTRVAAGTFAIYPAAGGGVVLVLNVDEGPPGLQGTMRKKLGPAMIRAMQAIGDGSGGLGAIKALLPSKRHRSGE